jgi:phosphoglucomutase
LAAGNKVSKLIIGKDGLLSTPAGSNLIRKYKATGGILLTASHNPGGPENDFGIKYNISNGGPAPESITDKIYQYSISLNQYHRIKIKNLNLSQIGQCSYNGLLVEIVDPVEDYLILMKEIFDFDSIRAFILSNFKFKFLFDAMHAITGPYAKRIFIGELKFPIDSCINCTPKEDFGKGHPDPNLTYAHELVELVEKNFIDFGAASDGDGDRNMIIGKGTFVNPSDSVASKYILK